MGGRVVPITVGELRRVMLVPPPVIDNLLQKLPDVLQQSVLILVQQEYRGGVQREEIQQAFVNIGFLHPAPDPCANVDQFQFLVTFDRQRIRDNLHRFSPLELSAVAAGSGQNRGAACPSL